MQELKIGQSVIFTIPEHGGRYLGHVVSFDDKTVVLSYVEQDGGKRWDHPLVFVDRVLVKSGNASCSPS